MFKMKKVVSLILVLSMCLSMATSVFADSGSSAIPQDSEMAKYIYRTFAPKDQTSYDDFTTLNTSVSKIKEDSGELKSASEWVFGAGGLAGAATFKTPYIGLVGAVTGGVGGSLLLVGKWGEATVDELKDDAVFVHDIDFKWTDAEAFEYKIKVTSWIEYDGEKISEKVTSYHTGDFY